jgi:hypothetical protein
VRARITLLPIDRVPDDELAVEHWGLTLAGERGSDAFMQIDAQIRLRRLPQRALRLAAAHDRSSQARFGMRPP